MRYWLVVVALILASCGREPLYQSQGYVFGTLVDISIYGESDDRARELANHVMQDFQIMHNRFHAWQAGSEIDILNQAIKHREPLKIKPDLANMIKQATLLSKQSGGVFNPAIGGLIQLWGFQRDEFSPVQVDPAKLAALVKSKPEMADIKILDDVASSSNIAVQLDLGGYAKGYALDQAAKYLRSQHVKNALINIGGNIIAIGQHGNQPWRVGIQHPRKPGAIATLDLADGWAIGTSGDYQRYFERDGKRYCHIIDPRTGYPSDHTQAVTILLPPGPQAGTLSDVASKPIFIANPDDRMNAAKMMAIDNYVLISADGKVYQSKDMAQRLHWVEHVETNTIQ